jgi:hypothetical protein
MPRQAKAGAEPAQKAWAARTAIEKREETRPEAGENSKQ